MRSQPYHYPKLVLASASPRRREILANAGFVYEAVPLNIDESSLPNEKPERLVRRLAAAKAQTAYARISNFDELKHLQNLPVLGADTVVAVGEHILGKPSSADDAKNMLRLLQGTTHEVMTGISIIFPEHGKPAAVETQVASTRVVFRPMSEAQIDDYVASGEPYDKAGGYGIQGLASKFVERIEGCYFNVVGLPISLVSQILEGHANGV